jgi:hypothetical protein
MCQGVVRGECKVCTIKRNVKRQRKTEAWRNRFVDDTEKRAYMRSYYARNKDKFALYREKFKKKHPDYFRNYAIKKKKQKNQE